LGFYFSITTLHALIAFFSRVQHIRFIRESELGSDDKGYNGSKHAKTECHVFAPVRNLSWSFLSLAISPIVHTWILLIIWYERPNAHFLCIIGNCIIFHYIQLRIRGLLCFLGRWGWHGTETYHTDDSLLVRTYTLDVKQIRFLGIFLILLSICFILMGVSTGV